MSQTKPKYKFGPSLPRGSALDWDMTKLTDEQLNYEHHLAYESLYGHTINGVVALPGLLSPDRKVQVSEETYKEALRVWQSRFDRSLNEIERRFLLS